MVNPRPVPVRDRERVHVRDTVAGNALSPKCDTALIPPASTGQADVSPFFDFCDLSKKRVVPDDIS